MNMRAHDLMELLATRHSGDVFVPECKDGPTQTGSHRRLDAWVMPRSWSKPWTIGYEVKVRRSDFLNDHKWPDYLTLCHSLYFVCPPQLIQPDELPAEVGLLWASKNATRLYAKKKAPLRTDVQIPEEIWRYVLMCRAKISQEHDGHDPIAYWQQWLAEREKKRELGYKVGGTVAKLYAEMETRLVLAERRAGSYERIEQRLEELGLDPNSPVSSWQVDQSLDRVLRKVSPGLVNDIRQTSRRLEALAASLETEG